MKPEYEKVLGTLLGVAYGDAIGMPSEMWTRRKIKERFGWISKLEPGQDDHMVSKGFKPGETTDDTAMTFLICDLLMDSGCNPEPVEFVRRVEAWAESTGKSQFVIGPSTRLAFDKIKSGTPVTEAGKTGITNGASMRISPVGIIMDYHNESAFLSLVEKLCMPTHYTNKAISAASAVAACVSSALRDHDPTVLKDVAFHFASLGEEYGNQLWGPSVKKRMELALYLSDKYSDDEEFLQNIYDIVGTGLPSNESVPSAIAIALRCGSDVERCGILSANVGGDTDTIGAISCAISGALAGADEFSPEVVNLLKQSNDFQFEATAKSLLNYCE